MVFFEIPLSAGFHLASYILYFAWMDQYAKVCFIFHKVARALYRKNTVMKSMLLTYYCLCWTVNSRM